MNIRKATMSDLDVVKYITHDTIKNIYPCYYPKGAVDSFLSHHSDENIGTDIESGKVFVLVINNVPAGTVTIKGNEISRLYVLPGFQGKGYGKAMLDFAEQLIFSTSETICLDSSLPSKQIYLKRGYKEVSTHVIIADNGDCLCYDVMQKSR